MYKKDNIAIVLIQKKLVIPYLFIYIFFLNIYSEFYKFTSSDNQVQVLLQKERKKKVIEQMHQTKYSMNYIKDSITTRKTLYIMQ